MGVPEYLPNRVRIRETTRSSGKYKLMKLSVPFVSCMYEDDVFTVAAPKYWNSIPDDLRTISSFVTFKCIQICYHYNVFF